MSLYLEYLIFRLPVWSCGCQTEGILSYFNVPLPLLPSYLRPRSIGTLRYQTQLLSVNQSIPPSSSLFVTVYVHALPVIKFPFSKKIYKNKMLSHGNWWHFTWLSTHLVWYIAGAIHIKFVVLSGKRIGCRNIWAAKHCKGRESGHLCGPSCFGNSDCFTFFKASCQTSNSVPSRTWNSHFQYKMPVCFEEFLKNSQQKYKTTSEIMKIFQLHVMKDWAERDLCTN